MKTLLLLVTAAFGLVSVAAATLYKPYFPVRATTPAAIIKASQPTQAPEISAESAAISIALLTGTLLLVSERSRARRT